jgi:hypothetical protein
VSVDLDQLQEKANELGHRIGSALPDGAGFALVLFDYGPTGSTTYISSAQREDLVKLLRELAEVLEHSLKSAKGTLRA